MPVLSAWKLWFQTRMKDMDGIGCLSKTGGHLRAITANYRCPWCGGVWRDAVSTLLTYFAWGALRITLLVQGYKHIIFIRTVRITTDNNNYMREKHDSSKNAENMKFNWKITILDYSKQYVQLTASKMALPVAF